MKFILKKLSCTIGLLIYCLSNYCQAQQPSIAMKFALGNTNIIEKKVASVVLISTQK